MFEETLSSLGLSGSRHKQLNLALQGGGAHGAYTWGVLDRLLEDDFLTLDTISGTSAGAVNAVALAQGFMEDGAGGARVKLEDVWKDISKAGDFISLPTNPMEMMNMAMKGMMAPFDHHPLDFDPLREILNRHIDFEALRKNSTIGIHIAATLVKTGKARIFSLDEISIDAVMASSCLPLVSKPVVIAGESYLDGGYSANPAIRPVIHHSNTDDTLLVQLSPVGEFDIKTHLSGKTQQLSFSQSLQHEIELIEAGREITQDGIMLSGKGRRLARHRFHLIDGSPVTARLNPGSEMTPNWNLLSDLFKQGREGAEHFLSQHRSQIGHEGTVDLKNHFKL